MALKIVAPISKIQQVSASEHDVERINSVVRRYKAQRQESKAPTFCLDLPRDIRNSHEELRILC